MTGHTPHVRNALQGRFVCAMAGYRRIRLNAIRAMPDTRPSMDMWCSPNSCAAGSSSSKEMNTIMPLTAAYVQPRSIGEMKGMSIENASTAPTGSARPEINVYEKAFFLLPVA